MLISMMERNYRACFALLLVSPEKVWLERENSFSLPAYRSQFEIIWFWANLKRATFPISYQEWNKHYQRCNSESLVNVGTLSQKHWHESIIQYLSVGVNFTPLKWNSALKRAMKVPYTLYLPTFWRLLSPNKGKVKISCEAARISKSNWSAISNPRLVYLVSCLKQKIICMWLRRRAETALKKGQGF